MEPLKKERAEAGKALVPPSFKLSTSISPLEISIEIPLTIVGVMLNIREKVAADNPAFNDSQAISFAVTSLFMSRPHSANNSWSIFHALAALASFIASLCDNCIDSFPLPSLTTSVRVR